MSKNKKKKAKFTSISVDFGTNDSVLPTEAHKVEPRGYGRGRGRGGFGRGGGRGGFDRGGFGSERKPDFDDSNFSRSAFGGKQPQSFNGGGYRSRGGGGGGFGSFGNRDSRGGGGGGGFGRSDFSRSDFGSRQGRSDMGGGFGRSDSFRDRDSGNRGGMGSGMGMGRGRGGGGGGFGSFRDSRSPPNGDMGGPDASEKEMDWRGAQKKEQPQLSQISLKTSGASPANANPWNAPGSSSRSRDSGGGGFGRSGFGTRSSSINSSPRSPFGGSGGVSKFAGGGAASSSKFASSSGFGASVIKNMGTGGPRVTYSSNSRFSSLMNNESPRSALEKPSRTSGNRFSSFSSAHTTNTSDPEAYPGLKPTKAKPKTATKVANMTTEQLEKEIKELDRKAAAAKRGSESPNDSKTKKKQKPKEKKAKKPKELTEKQIAKLEAQKRKQEEKRRKEEEEAQRKLDMKLARKFKKAMKENKSLEVDEYTLRMIEVALSGASNKILLRDDDNYEKIAKMVVSVMVHRDNMRSKTPIDLAAIYNVIFHKTNLKETGESQFVALVLEILSQIEEQQSTMALVSAVERGNILDSFLAQIVSLESVQIETEFEEYELQYVYPLSGEHVHSVEECIASEPSMEELIEFVVSLRANGRIYSNYKTMTVILSYCLETFYFSKCADLNEDQTDDLAKGLIYSADRSGNIKPMARLIRLLCYADDDNKGDGDEEDDDEASSHHLLLISNILSISSRSESAVENRGLVSLMKAIENEGLLKYTAVQTFTQIQDDEYTEKRLTALMKLSDWIADLDARMARLQMERDTQFSDDDQNENEYAGNLLRQRKHKTAADYETFSVME